MVLLLGRNYKEEDKTRSGRVLSAEKRRETSRGLRFQATRRKNSNFCMEREKKNGGGGDRQIQRGEKRGGDCKSKHLMRRNGLVKGLWRSKKQMGFMGPGESHEKEKGGPQRGGGLA